MNNKKITKTNEDIADFNLAQASHNNAVNLARAEKLCARGEFPDAHMASLWLTNRNSYRAFAYLETALASSQDRVAELEKQISILQKEMGLNKSAKAYDAVKELQNALDSVLEAYHTPGATAMSNAMVKVRDVLSKVKPNTTKKVNR